jgi:hypothetical protein
MACPTIDTSISRIQDALFLDKNFWFRGEIVYNKLKKLIVIAWAGILKLVHLFTFRWRKRNYPTTHLKVRHALRCKGAYYYLKCNFGMENELVKTAYSNFVPFVYVVPWFLLNLLKLLILNINRRRWHS